MKFKWDIHVPQISRMNTDFFDLCGQICADFLTSSVR